MKEKKIFSQPLRQTQAVHHPPPHPQLLLPHLLCWLASVTFKSLSALRIHLWPSSICTFSLGHIMGLTVSLLNPNPRSPCTLECDCIWR